MLPLLSDTFEELLETEVVSAVCDAGGVRSLLDEEEFSWEATGELETLGPLGEVVAVEDAGFGLFGGVTGVSFLPGDCFLRMLGDFSLLELSLLDASVPLRTFSSLSLSSSSLYGTSLIWSDLWWLSDREEPEDVSPLVWLLPLLVPFEEDEEPWLSLDELVREAPGLKMVIFFGPELVARIPNEIIFLSKPAPLNTPFPGDELDSKGELPLVEILDSDDSGFKLWTNLEDGREEQVDDDEDADESLGMGPDGWSFFVWNIDKIGEVDDDELDWDDVTVLDG